MASAQRWLGQLGHTGDEEIKPATARRAYDRERVRREGKRSKKVAVVTSLKPTSDPARGVRVIPADQAVPRYATDAIETVRQQMRDSQPWKQPSKPASSNPIDDDLDAALNAGREWLPKPPDPVPAANRLQTSH